ncbi:oligosaccharide flippase family protein [Bacteroides sp. BFG-551]|nr:oligosaccharide flippase family protein [Bacteroides sp. BFG-551]
MSRSITANYFFNLLNTISGILFPLITFPYSSRILLAEGIGEVNFYQSIISYISLVVGLGMPLYAVREIARVRNDREQLNITTIEILSLHGITTLAGYLIVAILCFTVSKVQADLSLFLLLSSSIFLTTIGCEWFYKGIEDFKYITVRGLVVRIVGIILLFTLVKTKNDILWYGITITLTSVGNNIFNFVRLRKYLSISKCSYYKINPFKHLKSVGITFLLILLSTIYLTLNPVILGFMTSDIYVGYYHTGVKLFTLVFGIIDSLTAILLPRFANLLSEGRNEEFTVISQKVYSFTIGISLPISVGLFFISQYAIPILGGDSFIPSIGVSQILSALLVLVGLSNVFGMQNLYLKGKIYIMVKVTFLACIADLLVCFLTIPTLKHYGAAMGYLAAELVAVLGLYFMGRKYISIKLLDKSVIHYLFATVMMGMALYILQSLSWNNIFMCVIMVFVGVFVYMLSLLLVKDSLVLESILVIKNKLLK